tara:strand:- start:296 stop:853 length:558 start_codon:yes stop_codon:yes gene_type:complete
MDKKINLTFTENVIKEAQSKIPTKIKEHLKDSDIAFKFGYVRFENDIFNSIYFYPNGYDGDFPTVLKYEVKEDKLIFKYIYLYLEDKDGVAIEARYDEDMNLESKYYHYDERIPTDGGKIICSKPKENESDVKYIFYDKPKEFSEYLKYLQSNNIIKNKNKSNNYCFYGKKQKTNVVYLVIFEYK